MEQSKEIWEPIKDYEGIYEISNHGKIKSLKRFGRKRDIILNNSIGNHGYKLARLYKNGYSGLCRVHTLVWDHFGNGKRNGRLLQVDHIDNNKINNRIDNLQLLTQRENCSKYHRTKKHSSKYTGVHKPKGRDKWIAQIHAKGTRRHIGSYNSEEEAHTARQKYIGTL